MSDNPAETVLSAIVGIVTVCIIAIVAYQGWPVSGWLAVGLFVTTLLYGWSLELAEKDYPELSELVASIGYSTLYVNAGVALICVIQTVYYIGPFQVTPAELPVVEERISDFYAQLQKYANLKVLSIIAIVVIALNVALRMEAFNMLYMKSVRLLSMISLILLGATSFTAAGSVYLDQFDESWKKSTTDRIVFHLKNIAKMKRQLVALAWVEDRFERLDSREQKSLSEFFRDLVARPPNDQVKIIANPAIGTFSTGFLTVRIRGREQLLRHFSSELVYNANFEGSEKRKTTIFHRQLGWIDSVRQLGWINSDWEMHLTQAQQSLKSLRELNAIHSDKVRALSATRTAAMSLVVHSVMINIPGLNATIASDFVSKVTGGLASTALYKVSFDSVENFADAKAWIRKASGLRSGQEQARLQWKLGLNRFQNESADRLSIEKVEQSLRVKEVARNNRHTSGLVRFGGGKTRTVRGKSDRDLKYRIRFLGRTPNGLKIYSFRYHWSDADLVGVMAQDLLADKSCSKAVTQEPDGFYTVDYASLGLQMTTLEAWQTSGFAALVRRPLNESRLLACSQD